MLATSSSLLALRRRLPAVAGSLTRVSSLSTTSSVGDQLKTFDNQRAVPRLPIPELKDTAARYLKSVQAVATAEQYSATERAVNSFVSNDGFGNVLQERLHKVDSEEPHNWLENIWLQKAYLEWREPSFIGSNFWAQFADNSQLPIVQNAPKSITDIQLKRASGLIHNILNFNDKLNKQELKPEYIKETPLCMNQYKHILGSSRIAKAKCDKLVHNYPTTNINHIIVLYRNQIYKMNVIGQSGERLPLSNIEDQLRTIVSRVNSLSQLEPSVGLITSEHRDVVASMRSKLESLSAHNRSNFDTIDSALFAVCLDEGSVSESATDIDVSHRIFQNGGDGNGNNVAENRWFDKTIQIIVLNNGRAGINGEHTPADAVVPGNLFSEILKNEPATDANTTATINGNQSVEPPKHLRWVVNSEVLRAIDGASANATKIVNNLDSVLLHYSNYGSNWMKQAKVSPDAFIQMALQLAYYRTHGTSCPTYESASTRQFLHGRTETVRSCSTDSVAFVRAFDDKDVPLSRKLDLFKQAIRSHLEYMIAASTGHGADRHLLGLRTQIKNADEQALSTLFTDPMYINSMWFRLSTSNMSPGTHFYGGFAPVVPDGYGVNYAIDKNMVKFSISQYLDQSSNGGTDCRLMRNNIAAALNDLQEAATNAAQRA